MTNSGLPGQVMVKESALNVGSISNGSGLKFTYDANNGEMRSGFLSSPRFGSSSLTPAGDLYEVKFNMNAFDESTFYLNLFDVNLATGDNRVNASSSGPNVLNADCYKEKYGASVYSTFQHAAKWAMTPLLPSNQIKVFSNFFTMPNLPNEFGGFNIQIGPANSDNDCSADKNKISGNTNANPDYKLTYPSYGSSGMPNGGGALKSGDLIPNNFGIGVFWSAMNWFYHPKIGGDVHAGKWWKDNTGGNWKNIPTMISPSVSLNSVEVVRYAKNPYVLKRAQFYVKNNDNNWALSGHLGLLYEIKLVDRYVRTLKRLGNSVTPPNTAINTYKDKRNVILLTGIKQLPNDINATFENSSTAPATVFVYGLSTTPT